MGRIMRGAYPAHSQKGYPMGKQPGPKIPRPKWDCSRDGHKWVNDGNGWKHCSECGLTISEKREG